MMPVTFSTELAGNTYFFCYKASDNNGYFFAPAKLLVFVSGEKKENGPSREQGARL